MTRSEFGLAFADGSSWIIRALDEEAEETVRNLGMVLRLGPVRRRSKLCSVTGLRPVRSRPEAGRRGLTCRLGPARSRDAEAFRMDRVASAIAGQSVTSGGLLLHGALAVRNGAGFVLAGPSGVGKSTASRRLPAPWQSLSDDCTLVVRDPQGRYWAHPWPTWSLLRDKGLVASWPLEQAVPLKALLFLRQSAVDAIEPVTATPAAALIMESAHLLARTIIFAPDTDASRVVCLKYLRAAWSIAAAVPGFRLSVSSTGRFWQEIERAVLGEAVPGVDARLDELNPPARAKRPAPADELNNADERRRRSIPEPPWHLLSVKPGPKLIRFQSGPRTFVKLVAGRRVVASANDIVTEWYVRPPYRPPVRKRAAHSKSRFRSRKSRAG